MHDAADVVGIVADAEARIDGVGEAHGGPAVGFESGGARTRLVDLGDALQLVRREAAGTARRAAFAQRLHAFPVQRPMPAGSRGAAHPEFPGNLGLRESGLQVLSGHQAPAFHFVASQNALFGCIHDSRG